jgi:ectoine hydroxylase-related dioxygenase (phytanoyl-CoA dioxygenase family)
MLAYPVRARLSRARARLEQQVRDTLFGGAPSWRRRPNDVPWFDRPDALTRIDRTAPDADVLERWVRDGYVVLDDCVDLADVDEMIATLDGLWDASTPIRDLVLLDLREAPDAPPRSMTHAELLGLDVATRRRLRENSDWRIHGFHYVNAAARRLYHAPRLRTLVGRLLGRRARPIAAINFMVGSQQKLHQDMAVFHIYPHNHLIGAWIACEDVNPESGPLVLYQGSHRTGMFPGFTDYPQTNLRTADEETAAGYQAWVDAAATRYERHEFRARKGQVLLWHGMLIHGGAPIIRRGSSRKSLVLHYSTRGADRAREVHGPFRW